MSENAPARAAEAAEAAWAAVAAAHENGKDTAGLLAVAEKTSAEAAAVVHAHGFDAPANGTAEEADGIAEAWSAVWADALLET